MADSEVSDDEIAGLGVSVRGEGKVGMWGLRMTSRGSCWGLRGMRERVEEGAGMVLMSREREVAVRGRRST
jgi:hypothetical protein